ncbi:MAG TPA: cupin domain-containing protein [Phototrophicaceae bacterium]|nr:cupin domain-containing protein [Phototrophicaceae bacterium]
MASDWLTVAPGVKRRIASDGEHLMMVEVHFEPGAVGALHSHPHAQATYILQGRVNFTLGDQVIELAAGQTIQIPGDLTHGVLALEESLLLDVFNPPREDFRS